VKVALKVNVKVVVADVVDPTETRGRLSESPASGVLTTVTPVTAESMATL